MNNGFSTQLFEVRRGVRQGDPLSAYLFIIALELLLTKIRSDQDISGIGDKEIKLAAFGDDLTTFVQGIKSFERLSLTLNSFGICSGLKLNAEKTEALWLGSNCINANTLQINIVKVNEPLRFLVSFSLKICARNKNLNLIKSLKGWHWKESYFIW